MLANDQELQASIDALQEKLRHTYQYDGLIALESEARELADLHPTEPSILALIGAILRQRLEWDVASEHYASSSSKFPDDMGLRYEAALTGIDAGSYRRGLAVLTELAQRLNVLNGRQLRGFWRAAPMVGLYKESLDAFHRSVAENIQPSLPEIAERLELAAKNATSEAVQAIGMLSIGENCMPWSLGQRWGLRPPDRFLEQESPFNLAQTVTDTTATLLEDGLYPLIALPHLSSGTSENGVSRPLNNHYRFDFNHEWGSKFIRNNYSELLDRYALRINNLRRYLVSQPAVYVHYTERDGDLQRLAMAVRQAVQHDRYRLIIFDVWDGDRTGVKDMDRVEYHRIQLPRPDYIWYRPDDLDTAEGISFERSMQEIVKAAMMTLNSEISRA